MSYLTGKIITMLFPDKSWTLVYNFLCGKDGIAPSGESLLVLGLGIALLYAGIMLLLPSSSTFRKWIKKPRQKIRVEDFVQSTKTVKFARAVMWAASFFWVMNATVWFLAHVCVANIELKQSYASIAHLAFRYVILCSVIWVLYRLVYRNKYRDLLMKEEILPVIHSALLDIMSEEDADNCDPAFQSAIITSWTMKNGLFDLWYKAKSHGASVDGRECLDLVLGVIYNAERPYKWITKREKQTMERVRDALRHQPLSDER